MAKKIEADAPATSFDHSYISGHIVRFVESSRLQKKKAQETIGSEFKSRFFYTESLTEVCGQRDRYFVDERLSWYDAIESGGLRPSIDRDGNVRLFSEGVKNSQHAKWCEIIEVMASQWIERESFRGGQAAEHKSVDLILQALTQLTRYLPELQQRQPNYFLDVETYKIGVTLQGEGTLTLLIGGNSEVEYSYAQRQEKGTVRISGIAKLTTNIRNSKNIWKLLNLQGVLG
ncbi:hypothetical protein EGJ86_17365 [Pseudomonas sp. o96-267]|uniref:hypothetical protein n=1 Tax=Pseudomonas sp. o96-267 TaxID=2479853 RepID=UPI000F7730B9|nr:hypothetical protein [Pseudomonas sp. o96-267]RRV33404.1 hypothetical protein EGJ86_17365 [Pseudomonas sp. o96-267]